MSLYGLAGVEGSLEKAAVFLILIEFFVLFLAGEGLEEKGMVAVDFSDVE